MLSFFLFYTVEVPSQSIIRCGFGVILTKCFWSGCFVSYLYSFVVYLYVNGSGSITSVGEERANLSAVVYL